MDLQEFENLDLNDEEKKIFAFLFDLWDKTFQSFKEEFCQNRFFCYTCAMKSYMDMAWDWQKVLSNIQDISTHSYSVDSYLLEFYLVSFVVNFSQYNQDVLEKYGNMLIKSQLGKNSKQKISPLSLYERMMNLFLKNLFEKVLDKLVQIFYSMSVSVDKKFRMLDFFLMKTLVYMTSYSHMYDEISNHGKILIMPIQRLSICSEYSFAS